MTSQDLQLPLTSDWLVSDGWRTVGHCTTQSDKRVVRKSRQVYRTNVPTEDHSNEETKASEKIKKAATKPGFINEGSPQVEIPRKIREQLNIQKSTLDDIVEGPKQAGKPENWSPNLTEVDINNSIMSRYTANSDFIETKSKPSVDDDKQPSAAPRDYSHRSSSVGRKADYIVGLRGESPPTSRAKRSQKRVAQNTTDFEPIEGDITSPPNSGVKPEVKSEWYKQMFKSMNPDSIRGSEKDFASIEEDDLPAYNDRSSRRPVNFPPEQTRSKSTSYQNSTHNSAPMNSRNSGDRSKADHFREFLDFDDSPQPQMDSRDRRAPTNHLEADHNDEEMMNGFREIKRKPNHSDPKSVSMYSPNQSVPQGSYHKSRASLDQKTLLQLAASVNEMKETEEKEKPVGNVSSNNRGRKERPKRIDEFHQIKNYFDTLSKNAEESKLERNPRRTQSLDRAKVSNRSQALGNKNFENIQRKFNSPSPGPGNISERKNEDQSDGKKFSKWKLSSVDEYYLNQRQYRYTIREPKAVKPPRPQLPPSSAIDTDFITQKSGFDRSNGDVDSGYARSASPRENGSSDERHDKNLYGHFEEVNEKSTYALSLHPSRDPQQFGGNSEIGHSPNRSYLETEKVGDAGESDSDDTASLPSQVENYHRPGSSPNVVHDPVVRANLEEKIQKCKGKINGNHDIYGSRNSLKQQTELTDQIDIGWNQPVSKMDALNGAPVSRSNSGRKPLVKSGIDIWQNRIEAVETAKNRSPYDPDLPYDDSFNMQSSPGEHGPERLGHHEMMTNFDDPNMNAKDGFAADVKDGFVVTPTDSNKSSMKESEAEAPEYNFYLSNRSFLNSIPQPYNKLKVGAPYESSATFRKRPEDLRERENRNVPKVTTIGPDLQTERFDDVTKNVERMLDAPAKINDEFSEQGEKTVQREFVEQLVYFPKSKEFFTIENDRDKQQLRFKSDPHYFITVTRKQTEEVLTKIDSGSDTNCPRLPINEDVRSFAREITNRRAGSAERSPSAPKFDSFEQRPAQLPLDRFADASLSRTNLNSQNHMKETVLNSPTKKQDYSGSKAFRADPYSETFNSNSNLRDSLLSPIENEFGPVGGEFVPPHHSTANRSNAEPRDGFQSSNHDLSRVDSSSRYRKNNSGTSNARVALSSRVPSGSRSASVDALNVVSSDGRDTNSLSDFKINRESGTRMPLSQHRSQNRGSYTHINGTDNDEMFPLVKNPNAQSNDVGAQKVFKDDSPDEYGMHSRRNPVNTTTNMSMSASALNEFNSKEADSGVELDYNSGPNSDELRLFQSESNLYDDKRLAPASDPNEESPIALFGNTDQQKNDNAPVKESSSRPIKKVLSKIFKKKPKNREDLNGTSSAQSGAEDGGNQSPTSPPAATSKVTSEMPATKVASKPSATVMFTFRPEFQGEIAVQKGDVVSLIRNVDENWVEIESLNGIGIVPKDYIKINKGGSESAPSKNASSKDKQPDKKGSQSNVTKSHSQKDIDQLKNSEKSRSSGFSSSDKHADSQRNNDKAGSMRNLNGSSMKPLTIQVNNYNNDKQSQRHPEASTGKDRNSKSSKPANSQEVKRVRVKHNFRAENEDDLALRVNEIVNVTKRVDENWYEGTIGKRRGIFPVNCVEVIETHENLEPSPGAYSPQAGVETSFNSVSPNKSVTVTSHQSDKLPQWQSSNSLNSLSRMKADQGSLQDLPPGEPFKVIFRYQHQKPDELDLEEGDILYAIEKCDDGWFIGTSERTGKYGTFPGNYVTKINL